MLLSGVVMLVFSACCLMSRFMGLVSRKILNIGNNNTVEVLIFNPNDPCISVHSMDVFHTQQQQTQV